MSKLYSVYKPATEDPNPPCGKINTIIDSLMDTQRDPTQTTPVDLDPWIIRMAQHCAILSEMVYSDANIRQMPVEVSNVIFDERVAAKYRLPYLIVNSEELNRIFVALRGSYSLDDIYVDTQAKCKQWKDGWAHKGTLKSAIYLYSMIRLLIKTLSDGYNQRPVTITGHSLGAGVAALVVEMFKDEFPDMKITGMLFAPIAALSHKLLDRTRANTISFVIDGDPVPYLSMYNFRQRFPGASKVLKQVMVKMFGRREMSSKKEHSNSDHPERPVKPQRPGIPLPAPALEDALASPTAKYSSSIQLFPPGQVYVLERQGENDDAKIVLGKVRNVAIHFGSFVNNLNVGRHSIVLYNSWLDHLFMGLETDIPPFFPERHEIIRQIKEKLKSSKKKNEKTKTKVLDVQKDPQIIRVSKSEDSLADMMLRYDDDDEDVNYGGRHRFTRVIGESPLLSDDQISLYDTESNSTNESDSEVSNDSEHCSEDSCDDSESSVSQWK